MCWNGYDPPRDEDQWEDSSDADYSWNDGQGEPDGDQWKEEGWPGEELAGPEYYRNKGHERVDDENERRNRRRRRSDDTDPES